MKREDESRSTATTTVREAIKESEEEGEGEGEICFDSWQDERRYLFKFPFFLFLSCTVAAEQQKMVVGTGKLVRSYLLFFVILFFIYLRTLELKFNRCHPVKSRPP